ncbi:MAG: L,D-transpeptidase family protein [Rhizobiales bacterium]|nr:L,D-transpeptidase family protein [Hyphomicrobiales bacterium]
MLAVAGVFAAGLTDTAIKPAKAQGFFNGGGFAAQRYRPRLSQRSRARRPSTGSPFWWGGSSQPQYPQVKAYVSSPKYFTYKPDLLNQISFKALAETKVAAAGPLPTQPLDAAFDAARAELETFEMQALPEVGAALIAHYKRYPEFLWADKGHVNARAYEAITALKGAERFGLSSEDYAVELPAGSAAPASSAQIEPSLIAFELTMSAKVLTFVLDANRGRIDPNRLSGYHDFKRKKIDLAAALVEIAAATDIASYLDAKSPDNEAFAALASELEQLRGLETPQTIKIAEGTFLRPGEQSPELVNIVAAIKQSGSAALLEEHQAALDAYADGSAYGEELVALVKGLQKEKGLSVDGVIGKNTIRAMVPESNAGKIAKIELAMERLRWLPRQLGPRHVFINQPAFKVTYFEPGKDPLSMRVVVGKKSNQTNFFMDKIEKVEYNPYWGVPRSIIINEMLPQLYADPNYLDRAGYEVSDASGRRVSSSSVNWGGVAAKQVPINVRQPPGARNALGRVKILFPNKHAIYMHDTPQRHLFERDTRAFSHGCVRLHQPREMAAAVLGKSVEYVDARIGEGRNASEEIDADIPVYVSYFTAWPEPDGTVRFYEDMYDRDDYLTRAIKATNSVRHAEI